MPMKKTYRKRKAVPRRRPLRLRRRATRNPNALGGPNTCKIVETLASQPVLANTPYIVSVGGITGARAQAVAEQFGLYRIAKVIFKFKPNYDTFNAQDAALGNGPASVPTLYWKMNRFADAPAYFTSTDLKTLGAKPIRFDDKQYTLSYKPNILTGIVSGGDNSGQVKMTPWLNTDQAPDTANFVISDTNHYGHFHLVECAMNGNGSTPVGTFDATIIYEFKNPRTKWTPAPSGESAVQALKDV